MGYLIRAVEALHPTISRLEIEAPEIARKALPGQFVIIRIDERGERIPLTVFRCHPDRGTIEIVVQKAGASTHRLCAMIAGAALQDVIGPLGTPTEISRFGTVVCVGGGVGIAEMYPLAAALVAAGNTVVSVIGARAKELLLCEPELRNFGRVYAVTDDGSNGNKGLVTDVVRELMARETIHRVFAVGPVPMMRAIAELTRPSAIATVISLNSIMVDGTGMCGSCRVTVNGSVKFVCVDGPDFDAHQVDFQELSMRQRRFAAEERQAMAHYEGQCRCQKK